MRARYYNPEIMRFINVDPIKDGWNWYAYANGDPISLFDPFGLSPMKSLFDCGDGINWRLLGLTALTILLGAAFAVGVAVCLAAVITKIVITTAVVATAAAITLGTAAILAWANNAYQMYSNGYGIRDIFNLNAWASIDPGTTAKWAGIGAAIGIVGFTAVAKFCPVLIGGGAVAAPVVEKAKQVVSTTPVVEKTKQVVSTTPVPQIDPNKLNHIFGKPEHNFNNFLREFGGNQTRAYNAIYEAAQNYVTQNKITGIINKANEITVTVCGYDVTFRGNVIDGILNLGTTFIK